MKKLAIDYKIALAKANLEKLISQREKQLSNKSIKCASCGDDTKIREIELISVEYYVQPYSCTGGDYWTHGEYNYICPKCQVRNRLLFGSNYTIAYEHRQYHSIEKYFFNEYRSRFKNVISLKDSTLSKKFVNNHYVNENIKKFLTQEKIDSLDKYKDKWYA